MRYFAMAFIALLMGSASAQAQSGQPAVSGLNGKLSVEGGLYDNEDAVLALGSVSIPVAHAFGLQLDGALGSIDGDTMSGGGAHAFTRDPAKHLIGVYGSYHTWRSIDIARIAAEGELYMDRLTISGLAGYEHISLPGTYKGLTVLDADDGHFFGRIDFSYYLMDDLKVSAGYRYEAEASLASFSGEYLLRSAGTPISLFAKADVGETEHNRITGGIKLYLGGDGSKSLMRRDRTEDPQNYTPIFPDFVTRPPPPPKLPASQSGVGRPPPRIGSRAISCDERCHPYRSWDDDTWLTGSSGATAWRPRLPISRRWPRRPGTGCPRHSAPCATASRSGSRISRPTTCSMPSASKARST